MSRRMNVSGFSMARMRGLFGSGDEAAMSRIGAGLARPDGGGSGEVMAIVERAIREGVPFPELVEETHRHEVAAQALAMDGQEFLFTSASCYGADALADEIYRPYGRIARPDVRGFLRALAVGLPLFGQSANRDEGSPYAAIGLNKLQGLRGGLVDLREQIVYRTARRKAYDKTREHDLGLVADFCDSIDQIIDAKLDLWFSLD